MFRKSLAITAIILTTSACAPKVSQRDTVNLDEARNRLALHDVNTRLFALEETLLESFTEVCRDKEGELRKQLTKEKKRAKASRNELLAIEKQCNSKDGANKMLLGEIEDIELPDQDLILEARIDTGAETSSLGVYKLTKFERDGKDWVKFRMNPSKKAVIHEYPVHDDVRIKMREETASEARFEIKLDVKLGGKTYRNQLFNLASRRHFEYQVLIGRNFLRDIAVVDVGTKHQLKRK